MLRLELAIYEALGASAGERRAKVEDAINKEFSPQVMVQCYNQVRDALLLPKDTLYPVNPSMDLSNP